MKPGTQVWAVLVAFAGWLVVLCGLRLAPVSVDPEADLEGINLAGTAHDGQHLHVLAVGEVPRPVGDGAVPPEVVEDPAGLAGPAPRYAALFAVGAFASLGLPGFSGFIAEFQIFAGSIAVAPITAIALPGILVTAALFLRALQQVFTGPMEGRSPGFADLRVRELWSVGPLLALSVLIGVLPRVLLEVIEPASAALVSLVGR